MAVENFYDQVSTKECAGRGDRTQGTLACQADMLPIELPRPVGVFNKYGIMP